MMSEIGHPRVQRPERVLEDDLHPAPQRAHVVGIDVGQLVAVEHDPPVGRRRELDDRPAERRLAAAGLADEAERLARHDLEVDAVDRVDRADLAAQHAAVDREVLLEALDGEQRLARRSGGPASAASAATIAATIGAPRLGHRVVDVGHRVATVGGRPAAIAAAAASATVGLRRRLRLRVDRRASGPRCPATPCDGGRRTPTAKPMYRAGGAEHEHDVALDGVAPWSAGRASSSWTTCRWTGRMPGVCAAVAPEVREVAEVDDDAHGDASVPTSEPIPPPSAAPSAIADGDRHRGRRSPISTRSTR